MPAPYSAGSIFVSVVPSFKDNQRSIAREYQRRGEEASKSFSDGFDKQIARDLPKAMEKAAKASKPAQAEAGNEAGKEYSSAFRKSLVDGLKSAERDLERAVGPNGEIKVPIDADPMKFRNQFNALVRDVRLTRADLEVGADVGQALYDVDRLQAKLASLRDQSVDIDTRSNLSAGAGALDTAATRVRQQANLIPEESQQAQPQLGAFQASLRSRLGAAMTALPPIPVDADITPAAQKIIEFRTDAMNLIGDLETDVHLDGDDTLARARALMALLEGVVETADPEVEVDASFNAAGALAQLKTWEGAVDPVEVPIEPELGAFRRKLAAATQAAASNLPEQGVGSATRGALTKLSADVDIDDADAIAEMQGVMAVLQAIVDSADPTVDVGTKYNAAQAFAQVKSFVESVSPIEIPVEPEMGSFRRKLASAAASAASNLPDGGETGSIRDTLTSLSTDLDINAASAVAEMQGVMAVLQAVIDSADPTVDVDTKYNAAQALAQVKAFVDSVSPVQVVVEPELGAFRTLVVRQVKEAAAQLPKLEIDADSTDAQRELASIRTELSTLAEDVKLDMDIEAVREKSRELQARLADLRAENVDIDVDVDTARAIASLEKVDRAASDADGALRRSGRGADDGANSFRAFSGVILGVATLGPAAIPVMGAIGAAAAATGPLAVAGALGLGVFAMGIMGVSDALSAMGKVQDNAVKDAKAYSDGVRNASRALDGAEQALASAQRAREDQAKDGQRSIRNAIRSVDDARQNAAEAGARAEENVQRAVEGVEDAQKALTSAQRDAERTQRGLSDANRSATQAEENFADAQRDAEKAQTRLTEAREEAGERILELREQIRGGALDERRAIMQLAEAEVAYANAMADPGATRTEREQLLLSLDEQRFRLDQVRDSNRELAEEEAERAASGIEGSEEVVAAQDGIVAANERVEDAQQGVVDANQRVVDAQQAIVDANERVVEAQAGVVDAVGEVTRAQAEQRASAEDSARSIADAEERLQDTREDVADAALRASEAVTAAQARVADAQADYADAVAKTSSSQDALALSMAKLSPAGREFAEYLFSLKPLLSDLQDTAAAGLLPGLQEYIQGIVTTHGPQFKSIIGGMSEALGQMFVGFGEALQGSEWSAFFDMLESKGPVFLGQIGDVLTSLGNGVASLLTAFAPSAENFGNDLVGAAGAFEKWAAGLSETQGFQDFMAWWERVGPKVVEFFKQLGDAVVNIGIALAPYGEDLLELFTGILNWISETDTDKLDVIVTTILGLVIAFQTLVGLNALIGGFSVITGIASSALTVFSGSAVAAQGAIAPIAALVIIVVAALALIGIALYLLWTNSETFRDIVIGVWNAVRTAAGAVADWFMDHVWPIMQTVFRAIGDLASWLWNDILQPIFEVWQIAWGVLWGFIKDAWDTVGYPMFQLIWSIMQETWQIIEPLLQLIGMAFGFLWDLVKLAWDDTGKPIFDAFIAIVKFLWEYVISPILGFVVDRWEWMFGIIKSAWETVGKPIFDLLQAVVEGLVGVFQGSFDGIKGIWDALLEVFKAPIKFVVETVLNKGLIAGINTLAAPFVDGDWIAPIPLPAGFAFGGAIPGNSPNKRADNIPIMATAGEFMQPVDSVDYYGTDFMEALRSRAIPREALAGYAYGGLIDPMWDAVRAKHPTARLTSHYRPGDPGYHGKKKAIDVAGSMPYPSVTGVREMLAINRTMAQLFPYAAELIHSQPGAINLMDGKPHTYSAQTRRDHADHNHLALDSILPGKHMASFTDDGLGAFLGDPLGTLRNMVTGAAGSLGDTEVGQMLLNIPFGVADMAKDRLVGIVSGLLDAAGNALESIGDGILGTVGLGDDNDVVMKKAKGGVQEQVRGVADRYGWGSGAQWTALSNLIQGESGWNMNAANPTSSARGLLQKMTSLHGPVEKTAVGQAEWGLNYIEDAYGDPVTAYRRWNSRTPHWYADGGPIEERSIAGLINGAGMTPYLHDDGGTIDPGWNLIYNATRQPEASLNPQQLDNIERIADSEGGRRTTINLPMMPPKSTAEEIAGAVDHTIRSIEHGGVWAEEIG